MELCPSARFFLHKGWAFNPGTVYKRQIRLFRKISSGVAGEQVLTNEVLVTLASEVKTVLNSRPQITVSNDVSDLQPLTPNHLLLLKAPNFLLQVCFRKGVSISGS